VLQRATAQRAAAQRATAQRAAAQRATALTATADQERLTAPPAPSPPGTPPAAPPAPPHPPYPLRHRGRHRLRPIDPSSGPTAGRPAARRAGAACGGATGRGPPGSATPGRPTLGTAPPPTAAAPTGPISPTQSPCLRRHHRRCRHGGSNARPTNTCWPPAPCKRPPPAGRDPAAPPPSLPSSSGVKFSRCNEEVRSGANTASPNPSPHSQHRPGCQRRLRTES
jgi:hypothetical protein